MMRSAGIPTRVVLGYQGGEVNPMGGHLIVRLRARGDARELVVLGAAGLDHAALDRAAADVATEARATHALRLGGGRGRGWIPVPSLGPILTWRNVKIRYQIPPIVRRPFFWG